MACCASRKRSASHNHCAFSLRRTILVMCPTYDCSRGTSLTKIVKSTPLTSLMMYGILNTADDNLLGSILKCGAKCFQRGLSLKVVCRIVYDVV